MSFKNPEKQRLAHKRYREANREKISEQKKESWKRNRDKWLPAHKDWYLKNREKTLLQRRERYKELVSDPNYRKSLNARNRAIRDRYRALAIEHYGGKCACCGETEPDFLSFDHIGGGGSKHRKGVLRGRSMGAWLVRNGYPEGFRILCHNCNLSIGFYGYCPHQQKHI